MHFTPTSASWINQVERFFALLTERALKRGVFRSVGDLEQAIKAYIDATSLKVREGGRIVSVAAIIAMGVNQDGRREILGLGLGPSEAATFWLAFLRSLQQRGLAGVRLVISDAHEGLKAAIAQVFKATWQHCRVHFMRNWLVS